MKVLHVAAEIYPLVKTGGLADVVGALPQALIAAGADVRVVLPGFPAVMNGLEDITKVVGLGAAFGAGKVAVRLATVPGTALRAYVVDAPYLYDRLGNPYSDSAGNEWADNLQRFALLSWVAAHIAAGELDQQWQPEVLHCHDWHAALACAYKASHPASRVASIYTIHNLAYQGLFAAQDYHLTGLPAKMLTTDGLEFHGGFSFMKAGITYADRVTTVSPTYAKEITTPEFGNGLDGLIRSRGNALSGILNGVDRDVWSPDSDPHIHTKFSTETLQGKAQCKAALQTEMKLPVLSDERTSVPLFVVVSRLTSQKGLDLLLGLLPDFLALSKAQLIVQGQGDPLLEAAFTAAAANHPNRIAVKIGYDEAFAHRLIAGGDALIVPSRFEPCGLTQLYALRYGTVPVVRRVGGLADTVVHANQASLKNDTATGFVFEDANSTELWAAMMQAINTFEKPDFWQQILQRGMAQNFSWDGAAKSYLALYEEAVAEKKLALP